MRGEDEQQVSAITGFDAAAPARAAAPPRWRRPAVLFAAGALIGGSLVATAGIVWFEKRPSVTSVAEAPAPAEDYSGQSLLYDAAFTPSGIAVGDDGAVYIADGSNDRVLTLAPNATEPTMRIEGVAFPWGVAVNRGGDLFVTDADAQVLRYAPATDIPVVLSFGNLQELVPGTVVACPVPLAVQGDTVYVADCSNNRVLRLGPGEAQPTVLSFGEVQGLTGIAVAEDGTVYVSEMSSGQVLRLAAGDSRPTVVLGDIAAVAVAVDAAGAVYVADYVSGDVLRLAPGQPQPVTLPVNLEGKPTGLAVADDGTVYVLDGDADGATARLWRLAAQ